MAIPSWLYISQTAGTSGTTIITVSAGTNTEDAVKYTPLTVATEFVNRNVMIGQKAKLNPKYQYLTIEVISGGTISWKKSNNSTPSKTVYYSKDGGTTWTSITSTSAGTSINVSAGDIIYWRGNNAQYGGASYSAGSNGFKIPATCKCIVYGNIMSLIDATDFGNLDTLSSGFTFIYLFSGCYGLLESENLILPATSLTEYCYFGLFGGCSSLTNVPNLPATVLTENCYRDMFAGCTSLTSVPSDLLPATALAKGCYTNMFNSCTNLVSVPELPATNLSGANYCYQAMFDACYSLTEAPELPATTLAPDCYFDMFHRCTSLTTVHVLPATTLVQDCYYHMFERCTGLTTVPSNMLPATTLATGCYYAMFAGCTSLITPPVLSVTELAGGCYYSMFKGCTSLTTAPELPATTLVNGCYQEMFSGCTNLNYIKCLATSISTTDCIRWVAGVQEVSGTFIKASGIYWPTGSSGIPNNWTVQET